WEDPLRTLGTYLGALSILFGAHYLPLTQWALKAAMTTLGVVSVTEFASRSFSSDSLSTRLRPKTYRTVDEGTLNATLRDIHDLIQSGVIQAQKILYGEDLEKAFGAFIGVTALYGLAQVVAPFWLAVMALTSIFIAPLVNSPKGRKVAQDAGARAQDLANTTAEKGKELAKNGQVKASELSSKAQQAAYDAGNTVSNTAQNGKQAAADLTSRAASNASGYAADNVKNLPQAGSNAVSSMQGMLSSAFGDADRNANYSTEQNYTHGSSPNSSHKTNTYSEGGHPRGQVEYEADALASRASHSTHVGAEPPRLSAVDDVNRRAV
ncbi:hypothetical protein LY76DRAFT_527906, partial [Colletotrichum caudatum]